MKRAELFVLSLAMIACTAALGVPVAAHGSDQPTCRDACRSDAHTCRAAARADAMTCVQSTCSAQIQAVHDACAADPTSSACQQAKAARQDCVRPCVSALVSAVRACRASSAGCRAVCPPADVPAGVAQNDPQCLVGCRGQFQSCLASQETSAQPGSDDSSCEASLRACVASCLGVTPVPTEPRPSFTPPLECPCGADCTDRFGNTGVCRSFPGIDRCICVGPPTPTPTPQCTGDPCGGDCALPFGCSDGEPCPEFPVQPGQCQVTASGSCECLPVAQTPPPTPTPQCTGVPCGGGCMLPFACPDGSSCPKFPVLLGQCQLSDSGSCDCLPVPQTPLPTPTPQCASVPCGGRCVLVLPCPLGQACADDVSQLGECALDAAGSCQCMPATPPTAAPTTTPTPQCASQPCGGRCVLPAPCAVGETCADDFIQLGECGLDSAGNCQCAPVTPPAETPSPTPTPQCASVPCGGSCVLPFSCLAGFPCPEFPVRLGQCQLADSGTCDCVPVLATPPPTPTPQCASEPCGGSCVIPPPCPPGEACPEIVSQPGECALDAAGSCQCVPVTPPPESSPTPTPGSAHGHTCCQCPDQVPACFDFEWEKDPLPCPVGCVTVTDAECQATCGPGPQAGPAECVVFGTCTSDQDCDDGNPCSVDRCTPEGCTHECVCV
jgi:hypothetical protein